MPQKRAPIGEEFLELRARLEEWRTSHPRRTPLPEEMWAAAVELARRHGLYRTARALPIDYANLRKRLNMDIKRGGFWEATRKECKHQGFSPFKTSGSTFV